MKGIIDVQIKHKDGSIETRHENNVVFDLPALHIKSALEMPEWVHLLCGNSMNPNLSSTSLRNYSYFGLSEEEASLTQPEYRPLALVGVASNATKWYQSVPSKVLSGKSITLQESWTIGTALTLRSIMVHPAETWNIFSSIYNKMCWLDNTLYCAQIRYNSNASSRPYQKADFSVDTFSYSNSYANGFASANNDYSHCSTGCLPYKLANSSERIAFLNSDGTRATYPGANSNDSIAIYKYPDDNTLLRSFKLSQFTGFTTKSYDRAFIMNTGTKNYLFEIIRASNSSDSAIQSITVWQIPDTALAENETIASVKTDFLSEFWPTNANGLYRPSIIIGPYLYLFSKVFKVDDNLTITSYHGGSNTLGSTVDYYQYISLSDSGIKRTLPESNYSYEWLSSYGSFVPTHYNLTAANFSTPIELAEGDVLTVSYKIEVS